ncbi:histidine kinase [Polaribacter sp. MSW13]|uniref:Histidine kinase n=1 Tax=Polaribacter marinus TaxID=2916838 RepID=A0A9X1VMQ3_9FLAO|nr:histidine kinase [Polaribacter marinus]MCI2229369.1 histidine kinase [Polaribacter marinus]
MEIIFQDFSIWLQGMLFILIAYHTSTYFFTKDKSFVVYAFYLLLLTIYLIPKTNSKTSDYLTSHYSTFFKTFNWIIQIWFWLVYTWFSLLFLDVKNKSKKWFTIMKNYIKITFIVTLTFFLIDVIFLENTYTERFFIYFYTPISLSVVSAFLYVIYMFKNPLNKIYVIGLTTYLTFSLLSLYFSINRGSFIEEYMLPIHIFMVGISLEALIFSVGLGYKYHIYRQERDNYNRQLINELQKNEQLKDQLNQKLSEKVKDHKLAEIEALYENQINELKLTSLLSQMNPHFIFNALNSIKLYIINNESKIAAHYLNKFSKLIRKILEASTSKEVSLQEELETMDLYMTIENIRFSNEIDFNISVDENINLTAIKVPPLMLQPFLENALWHGLSSKKSDKKIMLSINKKDKTHIQITIEDNGIGRERSAKIKLEKSIKRKSIGISLTKDRLTNFVTTLKNDFSITYEDLFDKNKKAIGTKVILKIPLF